MNNTENNELAMLAETEESRYSSLFDYIANQQATFSESPFCAEDSLLLTQLAYLDFYDYVRGLDRFTLSTSIKTLAKPEILADISRKVREKEDTCRMITMAAASRRFGHIRLKYFVDITDRANDKQFAAVTFLLDHKTAFVSFRGTDNTIVGWRENFNMAYMTPVPAQTESTEYLRKVGSLLFTRKLYVGGHSKGGNLAIYSSMNCGRDLQKRILGVYNLDGPGFKEDTLRREEMIAIKDRTHILLPESSMIGTLLKSSGNRYIVRSDGKGFDQHNPMNWKFEELSLSYVPSLSPDAMQFDTVVDNWLDTLTNKQREIIVDALFEVINESGAVTFSDVTDKIKSGEITAFRVLKDLDAETRKQILPMVKGLGMEYLKAKMSSRK